MHSNERNSSMNNLETPDNPQPGNKLTMQHSTQKITELLVWIIPQTHIFWLFSQSPVNSMYLHQLHDTLYIIKHNNKLTVITAI